MNAAFLELSADDRRIVIEQSALRRNLSPVILEKDFWVCWLLGILFDSEFADSLVFKGGTALSKVFGPFAQFIQTQQPSANFLWFWQANPGDSFAGVWELGHVALTDAAVLAFLTVLAMRIAWWETSRAERAEHAYSEMLSAVEMYFVSVREK